ncbi:cytochrome ubiquinol oxidase subunit I [Streptomyces albidoflavus]|uniref:cytochrome ubiquinol oxidase subunit I n=1 Tax=Streptomyces albidoflavus TaxID=1886 RepID=UPI000BAE3792|nr:cytochrome ubiquinol oxidase subunit I [Streptomyces albidoflavus]MBF4135296.1 cytochrome ubiquinol oxidase subunit I [Streptomyces albidoflavus]PAX88969.1 cytochrome ubiquinol oxidase subunit I [Streptomyces albidoflavus]PAX90650.1 cytochrome ubiquinol oxidase subunit I [Streptomyces albidoflavus]PBO18016.1 cytochrome ubiquinol oxidase subunit I [Streptomyces albidoflavus]PBO24377.1 cytochrome ubiquinol oxidase subunit I [Streptomyces albidoflavus]
MDLALAPETLSRWQFGITTVYHFLFVPLTISLAGLTAGLQTAWVRTGKEKYLKATKFWGKLFLINIALGVVTGIVQEFQFGMNWSDYSRFVGDVFGAPLAFEALIAFFFESTFIGLWIFGWDKLPPKIHLACIWMVSIGTILSAYFILAANSWMQHPVGYRIDEVTGRAELTDFWLVLTQNTALAQFFHTMAAAVLTGGAFMAGIAAYHLMRKKHIDSMRLSLRLGLVTLAVGGLLTAVSGDTLGKIMYQQQPMKMSAAEALWEGEEPAPFSLFAVGDVDKGHNVVTVEVPGLLSFLAHNNFTDRVPGINELNAEYQEKYGPGDYRPNIAVAYWGFRWMIGFGMTSFGIGLLGLWLTRRKFLLPHRLRTGEGEVPNLVLTRTKLLSPRLSRLYWRLTLWTLAFPLIASSWGWIFTETGRQPWAVYGVLRTADSVSPGVSQGEVLTSMIVFTLLYAVLAVIEVRLLVKYVKAGPPELTEADLNPPKKIGGDPSDADRPMAFSY